MIGPGSNTTVDQIIPGVVARSPTSPLRLITAVQPSDRLHDLRQHLAAWAGGPRRAGGPAACRSCSACVDEVGPLGVDVEQAGEELVASAGSRSRSRRAEARSVTLCSSWCRARRVIQEPSWSWTRVASPAFCSTSISGRRGTKPTSWSGSSCSLAQSQLLVEPSKSLNVTHGLMMSRTDGPLVLERGLEQRDELLLVAGERPGHERGPADDRLQAEVERRDGVLLAGRRGGGGRAGRRWPRTGPWSGRSSRCPR